jgi:hypothetical protein
MKNRLPSALGNERVSRWQNFIEGLFKSAAPYLAARGDVDHTHVSHGYSLRLMQHEGGNRRVVEPAVILHDVGWSALKQDDIFKAYGVEAAGDEAERLNRIHETQGAAIAEKILQSFDYDPVLIQLICVIIGRHDSGKDAPSIDEALVKDADKLWRFSRIGFWQEAQRQSLNPKVLLDFLEARSVKWFFSSTALKLAEKELASRRDEMN